MSFPKKMIDFQPLLRMKELLKKSLTSLEEEKLDELGEMGAIQAFEVSYELVWKTLQKFLAKEGKETRSPRETFRLAAQFGYLDNPQVWFNFGEERNLTAHTYREDVLTELLSLLSPFVKELEQLIKNLEKKNQEMN
jgi:nucleotidyltransferase substrate binding protein (TIGR01987 family)